MIPPGEGWRGPAASVVVFIGGGPPVVLSVIFCVVGASVASVGSVTSGLTIVLPGSSVVGISVVGAIVVGRAVVIGSSEHLFKNNCVSVTFSPKMSPPSIVNGRL